MPDTPQQRAVLRRSATARRMRARFPAGTRVVATDGAPDIATGAQRRGTLEGTVVRHVPMLNAQGGHLVVEWDNGTTGRVSCGSAAPVDPS